MPQLRRRGFSGEVVPLTPSLSLRERGSRAALRSGWAGVVALALLAWLPAPTLATQPDERLPDPALERRARDISAGLRCLVCQNQSIDDSDAPLAKDLRVLVRERLRAGDDDGEVRDYVVSRYGEFVLLRPVLGLHTALLWLTPLLVLGAGAIGLFAAMRRRRPAEAVPALSPEESAALDAVLDPERAKP
jgi:cytochrome c-type biogenesis protein CcmH